MIIKQTVKIPDNRRLYLNLEIPREVPSGRAQIELKAIPFDKKEKRPMKLRLTKQHLDEMPQNAETPHTDALAGILAHLGNITLEEIRDERLSRHLK